MQFAFCWLYALHRCATKSFELQIWHFVKKISQWKSISQKNKWKVLVWSLAFVCLTVWDFVIPLGPSPPSPIFTVWVHFISPCSFIRRNPFSKSARCCVVNVVVVSSVRCVVYSKFWRFSQHSFRTFASNNSYYWSIIICCKHSSRQVNPVQSQSYSSPPPNTHSVYFVWTVLLSHFPEFSHCTQRHQRRLEMKNTRFFSFNVTRYKCWICSKIWVLKSSRMLKSKREKKIGCYCYAFCTTNSNLYSFSYKTGLLCCCAWKNEASSFLYSVPLSISERV